MSVFISWSGKDTASYRVAVLLKGFIPKVLQKTDCFISSETQAGAVWVDVIFKELQNRNIGLVCVTRENLASPWLNFEAGAIAKNVGVARMCPVLIDLPASDVPPPLSSFQMKSLNREEVLAICEMINSVRGDQALSKDELEDAFGARWPEFQNRLLEALKHSRSDADEVQRSERDILEEILDRVRALGTAASLDAHDKKWVEAINEFLEASIGTPTASHLPAVASVLRVMRNTSAHSGNPVVFTLRVPKFKNILDQLDTDIWPMLSTAGNDFEGDFWVFRFPSRHRDVFDILKAAGPKREALRNACNASGINVKLVCEGEEVTFDAT